PEAADALKTALAMGVDEAVLVSDPAMADSDSLASARILVAAIRKIGAFDLIVGGRAAIDGNTAATAVQIAALLGVPLVSYVAELRNLDPSDRTLSAVRLLEKARETVTSRLPALITVVKEINEPRYPSLIGIRKAARAQIPVWRCEDLGLDTAGVGAGASGVEWRTALPPEREAHIEMIDGGPEDAARTLVDRLLDEKVI
ncbi:MAG: electron transfer flavoprotein subunit beta/FixA family protein, partial [Gemmatimonadota bacterium]|nr:electron transfer flavoprotein subunit beta/FixA family protein [Gemmatimonadota bacterium]